MGSWGIRSIFALSGKSRAVEKKQRKQATDFVDAVCCPIAVVQGAAQ